jgi:hypothetical protein
MTQTKCLVIGSCTGEKDDESCPAELKLIEADFENAASLLRAEARAKGWIRPAGEMYIGTQHKLMMHGIERLRTSFSQAVFDVAIISAGYGLISEARKIAPYNMKFQKKDARERGKRLDIPAMTRKLLSKYQVIFLLLGENYLASLGDPLNTALQQKFIYFGNQCCSSPEQNIVAISANLREVRRYGGAPVTGIKGSMFDLFATGICAHPQQWKSFLADRTTNTLIEILDHAKRAKVALN